MKLLLDNNLPPALARALQQLTISKWDQQHQVIALRDKFKPNTPDVEWITALANDDEDWTVVTHDRLNKGLEREVLRRAGLRVFMLDKSWKNHDFWETSVQLLRWWPRIIDQAEGISGGAAFRVRWRISGKGKFEAANF